MQRQRHPARPPRGGLRSGRSGEHRLDGVRQADDDRDCAVLQREHDEPLVRAQRHEQLLQEQDHRQGYQVPNYTAMAMSLQMGIHWT